MKKPKTLKKKHKRTKYVPIYAYGGPQFELHDMNSGMSSLNGGTTNSGGFGSFMSDNAGTIGNVSSGVNIAKGIAAEEDWEKGYNTGMAGISKAGPVGGVIGGVTAIGDAIGDPIRNKSEKTLSSGEYANKEKAIRNGTIGALSNPFKAGMMTFKDPNATKAEKWSGALAVVAPGAMNWGAKKRYNRLEQENIDAVKEANRGMLASSRFKEESFNPTMKFANGGVFGKPQTYLGISGPQVPMSGPINPKPVGNFNYTGTELKNKLDYGQSYKRELVDDQYGNPTSLEYKMGYKYPEMSNSKTQINNKLKATGGQLEETRYNKDVTYYGGGYTHEDSPINGTPIGSKGLVEKDEVRYKDYIFSNRF